MILTSIAMIFAEFPAEKASLLALTGKLLMVVVCVCVCVCVCVRVRARLRHRTVPMEPAAAAVAPSTGLPLIPSAGATFVRNFCFAPRSVGHSRPSIERVAVDVHMPFNRPATRRLSPTTTQMSERGKAPLPCRPWQSLPHGGAVGGRGGK